MSLQRREAVMGFPDVDTWNPCRWENWTPTSSQYMPFNIGPRICLGRVFAHLQMEYIVARIVQEFAHIEWCGYAGAAPDDEPMRIKIELNTKFDKPIMCNFTPRSRT
jgi:cytochrome P450